MHLWMVPSRAAPDGLRGPCSNDDSYEKPATKRKSHLTRRKNNKAKNKHKLPKSRCDFVCDFTLRICEYGRRCLEAARCLD